MGYVEDVYRYGRTYIGMGYVEDIYRVCLRSIRMDVMYRLEDGS